MTQPTQDTDITSSISPLFHVRDELNEKLRTGNNVKKLSPGQPPTSFIMETLYSEKRESENNGMAECQGSELVKSLGETFPWLVKFSKVIQSAVGSKNPKLLDRLLCVYIENMSRDVNTCYTKPYRAAKVKTHISDTLIFFHLYWRNIKERVDDHNQYLDKMSEILGMYVDMELKASRRGKDSASKIAAKLLTAMFIYLDNSEEHIFRILFRAKFITKNYSEICGPIFTKLFTGLSRGMKCVTDVTYVRYLLALKLWKRIRDDLQEKKKINELALAILGQQTPSMNPELTKIIPKPPESHKNGTLWLLQPNSFDLRKACDLFIKYELNERIISLPDSIERLKIINSVDMLSTQISLESIDRLQQKDVPQLDKSGDGGQRVKRIVKLKRFKPSFPKLRPGEVVFIDLTAENEESKQGDGKKKKKRDKKKLKWLKEASKRSKLKKERKISDKTWVEKADAHSTEDTVEEINSITNNWPISEDRITESTERIQRFGKRVIKLNTDSCEAKQEKKKCDTTCEGCKFCFTTTERQGEITSLENLVTSQTSLLNNDAMVLTSGDFTKNECYPHADSFGEAASRQVFINRIKQELKDSGAHSSTIISGSNGSYCAMARIERNATAKIIKDEPKDVRDDSTTVENCDKIILTDSSSFNSTKKVEDPRFTKLNACSPVRKMKVGDTIADNDTIPSTSYCKNILYSSPARGKLSKVKERINQACVVSTTASILDSSAEEQINVISGSTSETLESNMRMKDFISDNNPESYKKEPATNAKKLFQTSKMLKLGETSKNCCKDVSGDTVNNKLQNSLIHALSLDEIIQIGRDDVDSQSEDDGDKEYRTKTMRQGTSENSRKKFTPLRDDNDFFEIPDIQLCDDLTNDNEVDNLVTVGGKNKVDEFENIDILDSILNGDMSMQDILEEQQHLSMNPLSSDTSTNMLGFFTEFFKQSEVTLSNKKDCATDETLHQDEVSKTLPEGSLGMTGILNSLLDSDLTSIDSPPSDFMYSNVQSVDPRLIRKSPTAERAAFLSDFSTVSDLFSQKEQSSEDNFGAIDSLSKKTKDQLFLDQKDSLNCTDLEEFGLNSTKETTFEMPVLEEELIQLPAHPLIDETITQISPSSCQSPLSTRPEIPNLSEVKPTDYNNIQVAENNYDYSKLNNSQEFTLLRLKDIIQHSAHEIDKGEDLPTSTLTDFTPPQSVDPPQSPYTFASSPASAQTHSQTVPHSPTHSIGISRHTILANMLTPPPSVPQLIQQNNLTPPPTPQQNQNSFGEATGQQQSQTANSASGNLQKNRIRYLSMNSSSQQPDFVSSLQKKENYEATRRKPQTKVTYLAENKKSNKADYRTVAEDQQQEAHLSHVQVALTRLTKEEINARASGEHSVLKSHIVVNREADVPFNSVLQSTVVKATQHQLQSPQLQRIDFREFNIASQQNKSVLINLNGKTKPALVFERNTQSDKLGKSLNEDVNSRSNIVYKLTSNVKPATSKDKPYSKLPKVNFTIQNERDIGSKPQSTITRRGSNVETSKEPQILIRPRCSTRRVKAQANKSAKEINVRKTFTVPTTEEPSLKKRKITSKFLPLLENGGIIYAVNQQKAQEKHSNSIRRGNIAVYSFFGTLTNEFATILIINSFRSAIYYISFKFQIEFQHLSNNLQLYFYFCSLEVG